MSFNLRRWIFEPEYKILKTLYFCQKLDKQGLARPLSRWLWRRYIIGAGCLISPLAAIGQNLHLPHPIGIVVSEDVRVGQNVTIYQNVTVGRQNADDRFAPVIGDNVTIYAGAVVVGGIHIGNNAIIGANSVVTADVAAGTTVVGAPARVVGAKRSAIRQA